MAKNIVVENARILFRNFKGEESKYNPKGNRNFCLLIDDPNLERDLIADGWNVKYLQPLDPGDPEQPYIKVKVAFGNYPPKIHMISGGHRTLLDEESVGILDWAEIENIDLTISPYHWDVSGRQGVTGYLKTMWVVIREDEFEAKYAKYDDSPISAREAMMGED